MHSVLELLGKDVYRIRLNLAAAAESGWRAHCLVSVNA